MEILTEIRDFLNELGYPSMGRDMSVLRRTGVVSSSIILDSATRTMESIRYCCMNANFADAYSFLRKFRDDLFYYVYQFAVADKSDFTQFAEINDLSVDEKNIWDWVYKCDEFSEAAVFVTISFLFLVVLIRPLLIMSYDYTDYLDVGAAPPEDS